MINVSGKRLLVLGGTSASLDVVKVAKKMGIYVIVVDDQETGVSKKIADESYVISTTDMNELKNLVKKLKIDGVFCGPSEFNIVNAMELCEICNLPFYATKKQWEICSNKENFKKLCHKFNVPCVPEYQLSEEFIDTDLQKIKYPVIVKPVDGCSSKGISVCYNELDLRNAIPLALKFSESKNFLVEKYITNDYGFGCRYIACNGEIYLSALNDRYTVDKSGGKAMISAAALFPSKKIKEFIKEINSNVIEMFKSIGIINGTFFMQALVDDDDKIYFHEMGLRLSGGLIYSMLEASCGFSDLKMMIRYAVGAPLSDEEELKKIDPYLNGKFIGSLCIPLNVGKISSIEGIDEIKKNNAVVDFLQYYDVGDVIEINKIGTLMQHFCRIKLMTNSREEYIENIKKIQSTLKIKDEVGNNLIYRYFDTERLK